MAVAEPHHDEHPSADSARRGPHSCAVPTEHLLEAVVVARRLARRLHATPFADTLESTARHLAATLPATVPKAVAARALSTDRTTVDRWIAHGDLPATPRHPGAPPRIPTAALLDTIERTAIRRDRTRASRTHPG